MYRSFQKAFLITGYLKKNLELTEKDYIFDITQKP